MAGRTTSTTVSPVFAPTSRPLYSDLSLPAHTAEDLALRLHCLSATTGGRRQLDPSHRTVGNQRNSLKNYFGNSQDLADKFVSVVQALSTLSSSTPGPGKDNIALMVGETDSEIHLFCAQNGGASVAKTEQYVRSLWKLVQNIHYDAKVPAAHPSVSSPPRAVAPNERPNLAKLHDLAYLFVKDKALDRAAKHLPAITAIQAKFTVDVASAAEDRQLVELLYDLITAAHDAVPHRRDKNFSMNDDWLDFRSFLRLLRDFTLRANYRETLERVRSRVQDILKDSEELKFDIEKSIEKIVKVEVALVTLYALVVSPRRNRFIELELVFHSIDVPDKSAIHVDVHTIEDWWYPDGMNREEAIEKMRGNMSVGDKGMRLPTTIHSECQIVAWMAQNMASHFPMVALIPYVTCSKLHCFGCYSWLSSFNKLGHSGLPIICYDGSHGKLHPGWAPPSLGTKYDQQMRRLLIAQVEEKFPTPTHSKEGSASTTASDPQICESALEDVDQGRLIKRRARRAPHNNVQKDTGSTLSTTPAPDLDVDSPVTGGVGSVLDSVAKCSRNLNKKLKAINQLKEKVKRGEPLEKTQLQKIANEGEIRRELESLGI